MRTFLDFEKPIAELEAKVEELRHLQHRKATSTSPTRLPCLQAKTERLLRRPMASSAPGKKVQVARHPARPHGLDYIKRADRRFRASLAGDRSFEDRAIMGDLGRFQPATGDPGARERGRDTESRVQHNFGMARPEGYRKARRLMQLADRFRLPVITLVDTAGAYPGVEAEARGQAEAIARAVEACLDLAVPLIAVIIGDERLGGRRHRARSPPATRVHVRALALFGDQPGRLRLDPAAQRRPRRRKPPRPCASAQDLLKLGVIDEIIPEPMGGAHRDSETTIDAVGAAIEAGLRPFHGRSGTELRAERRAKFLGMGKHGL